MNRFVRTLTALSLPLAFFSAGTGMLWLLRVRSAEGDFYARLLSHRSDWVGSHVVLLVSAVLVIPAVLALGRATGPHRGSALAGLGLLLAIPAAVLLGGQYAIDFVMPLVAEAGGEALEVHRGLFTTEPLHTLFYKLPELASLGLLISTLGLLWSRRVGRLEGGLILAVWVLVIAGGAVHLGVQRGALAALGLAFLPTTWRLLRED